MQISLKKKVAAVTAAAAVIVALFAAVAVAAPVLQPGTTSAPGMSGTCTNCHTYATTSAAPAAKPKPKATKVSHPFMAKGKRRQNKSFKVWGYISPKLANTKTTTLTVSVQTYGGHGSWITTAGVAATGTVTPKGRFKNKTNYTASFKIDRPARYRLRTKLIYVDAKGVQRTKWSGYLYLRVYK